MDVDDVLLNLYLEGQSSSATHVDCHILLEQDFLIGSATFTKYPVNERHN